jgi:hypothetical protein
MGSGEFGSNDFQTTKSNMQRKKLVRRILDREMAVENGARERANQKLMAQVKMK